MKIDPTEHDIQATLFEWAEWAGKKYPELQLLNGSLNGVRLTVGQAVKAKRAGMKKGHPDISLPVPSGKYHGLYIELKKPGGYPTPEQREWVRALRSYGYWADILVGLDATIAAIEHYLNLKSGEEGLSYRWEDKACKRRTK